MLWKFSLRLLGAVWQREDSLSVLKSIFTFILLLMTSGCWGQPGIPMTPAGSALQAWLDAINSGQVAKISAYVKIDRFNPERRLAHEFERTLRWLRTSIHTE